LCRRQLFSHPRLNLGPAHGGQLPAAAPGLAGAATPVTADWVVALEEFFDFLLPGQAGQPARTGAQRFLELGSVNCRCEMILYVVTFTSGLRMDVPG